MSREVELGWESWTSFASSCPSCSSTAVQWTLSLWLCPSTAVETAIAQCTSRWAMARGHCLNTSIVLAAVHGLSGLFRAVSAVEPSLCRPLPTLSPSLIGHLASVDVKHQESSNLVPKHTRKHEAHPPRVKKREFRLDSNDFGFTSSAGVSSLVSDMKQTSDITWVVCNKLTTVWSPTKKNCSLADSFLDPMA